VEQPISTVDTDISIAPSSVPAPRPRRSSPVVGYALLVLLLIGVGILIRLRIYLADMSLWRDEAALALNIIHKSFGQLFGPLDYDQGAPVGFLMIQKLAVTTLGSGEMALRLWPVTASILSIPLFFFVCLRYLGPRAALFALAFLALAATRQDYLADNKQYSTDCLVTIILLLAASPAMMDPEHSFSPSRLRTLAIAGAIAIWFSHPSVFVLAGIFVALAIRWLGNRPRQSISGILVVACAWGGSFLLDYFLCLRKLTKSDYLQHYWSAVANSFAPVPKSLAAITWYKRSLLEMFSNFSIEFEGLAAVVFLIGVFELYRRGRHLLALLMVPIAAALAASALHQYPFDWRLLIFAIPLTIMTIAAGLDFFRRQARVVQWVALAMLLVSPVSRTAATLKRPEPDCEMRQAVAFIAQHHRPGDTVYLFQSSRYDFAYYQARFGLTDLPVVVSSEHSGSFAEWASEFSRFGNRRIWVVEEDPFVGDILRESDFAAQQPMVVTTLDATGTPIWKHRTFNEIVACYDLGPESRSEDQPEAADARYSQDK
jgi:hypothetical protein